MMRRILTILIALLSITTIYAQETDVEKRGYKGKVKSVVIIVGDSVDRIGNHIIEPYDTSVVRKYNSDGNIIESISYRNDIVNSYILYKYDSDGNMIEEAWYYRDTLEDTHIYKYNSNGNMIEMIYYKKGLVVSKENYEYDSKGNKIDGVIEDWSGHQHIVYKYDSDWNIIEESGYYEDTDLSYPSTYTHIYKYNSNGDMIEKSSYYSDTLWNREIWKYDYNGNKIEEIVWNKDDIDFGDKTFKYDSDGNMIERSYYWEDTLASTQVFKYNSNGNLISLTDLGPDGLVWMKDIYKSDSKGNIVENIRFDFDGEDLILHSAIKFIIEYYD
jgi:hypothetical protein